MKYQAVFSFGLLAVAGLSQVQASPVTLSSCSVEASVNGASKTVDCSSGSGTVNKKPDTDDYSTTAFSSSTDSYEFSFSQRFKTQYVAEGTGTLYFEATSVGNYSIADPAPTVTGSIPYSFSNDTTLIDTTTGVTLYDTQSDSGQTSGSLVVGDSYEFMSTASIYSESDPALSYDPTISFSSTTGLTAAPEDPAPMIPVVLGALALLRNRLRRNSA